MVRYSKLFTVEVHCKLTFKCVKGELEDMLLHGFVPALKQRCFRLFSIMQTLMLAGWLVSTQLLENICSL